MSRPASFAGIGLVLAITLSGCSDRMQMWRESEIRDIAYDAAADTQNGVNVSDLESQLSDLERKNRDLESDVGFLRSELEILRSEMRSLESEQRTHYHY